MLSTKEENHDRYMVLDDEADDINHSYFQSVGAERLPMKIIENLSDIWVPAHLLEKRKNFASIYLNKPAVFRTLEKPTEKSFSVYDETVDQPDNSSAADFAQEDMLDLLNNYKSLEDNDLSGCDEVISATYKCSEINNYENLIKSRDSIRPPSSQKNLSTKSLEKNSEICDNDTYDYVKPTCLKTSIQTNDDNVKTSFDDIYDSGDEFCEKTSCTTSGEVLNEKCDSLVPPLNICEPEASVCMAETDAEEGACCNPDSEGSLQTDLQTGSKMDYVDPKELDESKDNIPVVNFPIAYKRPAIEETVKKQKNQKKKKNAQKKTVLDVFTQNNDSEYPYPVVDKFYESVMRREYEQAYQYQYPSLQNEFPDLNQNKSQNFTTPEFTSEFEEFKETENTVENTTSISVNSRKPTNSSLEIKGVHIVLENLPKSVSEDQVQAILPIGEVRLLYLSECEQFKIAEISMDSDTDAEWVIDCFNGVAPFGAGSSALKCYKLS